MEVIKSLLKSKKFVVSLVGLAVAIAAHFGLELQDETILLILTPILGYTLSQGVADIGKEKAKVENGDK
ncbi:MAG: hypothetical protein ACXAEN_23110 [Candidatus Thorarchaeota archaeon]|jgi:hypothetical protein